MKITAEMQQMSVEECLLHLRNRLIAVIQSHPAELCVMLVNQKFMAIVDELDPECPGHLTSKVDAVIEFENGLSMMRRKLSV